MPFCEALSWIGSNKRCGRSQPTMPYFWFRDSHGLISKEFVLCFDHAQTLLGTLMGKERGYKNLVISLYKKAKIMQNDLYKGVTVSEERAKMKEARDNGLPEPEFKNVVDMRHNIKEIYRKVDKFKGLQNNERNKTCRYCGFSLKEPEFPEDQISNHFSHADWHSDKGYRREVTMFHTRCGRIWLVKFINVDEKIRIAILPRSDNQLSIEQSVSS
jgi:hypothetical protein